MEDKFGGLPPWDGNNLGKDFWTKRVHGMKDRAGGGEEDVDQSDLPIGDKTVLRVTTIRMATRRRHWLDDPLSAETNSTLVLNCAANPEYAGNTADICPLCNYAMHRGNRKSGGADLEIKYFMLVIIGEIQTLIVKDSDGNRTKEDEVTWDYEPKIFSCTDGIFKSIVNKMDDIDYPKGANGDVTKYAFRINKFQKVPGSKGVRYSATPYGEVGNISEEVDKSVLPELWEKIRRICKPSDPYLLASKIGANVDLPSQEAREKPEAVKKETAVEEAPKVNVEPDNKQSNIGQGLALEDEAQTKTESSPTVSESAPEKVKEKKDDNLEDLF